MQMKHVPLEQRTALTVAQRRLLRTVLAKCPSATPIGMHGRWDRAFTVATVRHAERLLLWWDDSDGSTHVEIGRAS